MNHVIFPPLDGIKILFAHYSYRLGDAFAARNTGMAFKEVRDLGNLESNLADTDVLVCSGLWNNTLLKQGSKLRFVQSVSAGMEQYDQDLFARSGVRLASAQGVNDRAVAEHAMALILALARKVHLARDLQAKRVWRPAISDPRDRQAEIAGKTMVIVGLGQIGSRVARLAKAFDMKVIGVKSDMRYGSDAADEVYRYDALPALAARADIMVLTCALTPKSVGLINAEIIGRMRSDALLINVSRGRVIDEEALIGALSAGRLAGAGLDVFIEEPLPETSPFWTFPNVLITPHSAGETTRYEENCVDILLENLHRLSRGEIELKNGVV